MACVANLFLANEQKGPMMAATTPPGRIDRLRAGDLSEWQAFLDGYRLAMHRKLTRLLHGQADDAEELIQRVFIVIYRKIHQFTRRRDGSFRAWVREITRRQALKLMKELRRRKASFDELNELQTMIEELCQAQNNLADSWDTEHEQICCEFLLNSLRAASSSRDLELFMRRHRGESYEQLVDFFALPRDHIYSNVNRVRNRLRKLCDAHSQKLDLDNAAVARVLQRMLDVYFGGAQS